MSAAHEHECRRRLMRLADLISGAAQPDDVPFSEIPAVLEQLAWLDTRILAVTVDLEHRHETGQRLPSFYTEIH